MNNCNQHGIHHKNPGMGRLTKHISTSLGLYAKTLFTGIAIIAFSFAQTSKVVAQDRQSNTTGNVAINMCPLAIAFGIYAFNVEFLFGNSHGLVARYDNEVFSAEYSGDPIRVNGSAFILNYRYHWSGGMESFFLGSFARTRDYLGSGSAGDVDFDFKISEQTLGINAGKRWVWKSGFNIVFSLGYGSSSSTMEKDPSSSEIDSLIDTFEEEYTFLGPFLGEFSIGYVF